VATVPQLTPAGLQIATRADVRDQINSAWLQAFGASMDVSDGSPDGQQIGIDAEIFALLNELLEAIVASQDPNKATGDALAAICAITGTKNPGATFSRVTLTLTGTPTATVPDGSLASTLSTGQQFTTAGAGTVTIAAATAWAGTTAYAAGDRRTNASGIYVCTVGGISAGSGGPTGITRGVDIPDGSGPLVWRFLGAGTGFVDVVARATVTGPIVGVAGDITVISTPTGGWTDGSGGVVNILDATVGANKLTDAQLRVLRESELARPGTSPKNAIRAALLDVGAGTSNPVTSCTVFSNVTDVTDVNGIPPHSVLALVKGGEDQDIWDALLANVADGIRTTGTAIGTATDSEGTPQPEAFSRVTEINIYVSVTLVVDASKFPADGAAQIALAIATNGNARDDGTDVTWSWVLAQCFTVAGVLSGNMPLIGTAPSPVVSTTIAISLFQRAVWDTSRIGVSTSPGTP
jgi:hypothetical protein